MVAMRARTFVRQERQPGRVDAETGPRDHVVHVEGGQLRPVEQQPDAAPFGPGFLDAMAGRTSRTPSTRSFSHQDPAGPSTVRAFMIRMSWGSVRKAAGEFQKAQRQPSQSLVTGRRMWPSRLTRSGLGSGQLMRRTARDHLDVGARFSCRSAAVSSADWPAPTTATRRPRNGSRIR